MRPYLPTKSKRQDTAMDINKRGKKSNTYRRIRIPCSRRSVTRFCRSIWSMAWFCQADCAQGFLGIPESWHSLCLGIYQGDFLDENCQQPAATTH